MVYYRYETSCDGVIMYTFIFRASTNKESFHNGWYEKVILHAPDYYEDATMEDTGESIPWLKVVCRFAPRPLLPCGGYFSFDNPFSPWHLYYALSRSDCYFELETDYPGDVTKWPSDEEEEVGEVDEKGIIIIRSELGAIDV